MALVCHGLKSFFIGEKLRWRSRCCLPDVQPGERLTGLYQPGQGMRLWHGPRLVARCAPYALKLIAAALLQWLLIAPATRSSGVTP